MQQTDGQLVERVVSAIHGHLSRRNIMQYLDNPEDCEGIARVCIEALSNSTQADAGLRDKVQFAISAWAWAQDIDGAVRNDLFERIDTALTAAPTNSSVGSGPTDAFHLDCPQCGQAIDLIPDANSSGDQGMLPTFRRAWARYEAKGYQYGGDALENVAFGYRIASEELAALSLATPTTDLHMGGAAAAHVLLPEDAGDGLLYNDGALAERAIDFLEDRADEWMSDGGVQRMFNAIASVFEAHAPQEIMNRFREKLGVIGRQCFVEGALRSWEEIAAQQRALGTPLPPLTPTPSQGAAKS